jgi:hypothetical protein
MRLVPVLIGGLLIAACGGGIPTEPAPSSPSAGAVYVGLAIRVMYDGHCS